MMHYHFTRISHDRKRGVFTTTAAVAALAAVAGTAAVGVGAAKGISELSKKPKKESAQRPLSSLTAVPKPEDAEAKARSEITRRKRILALSGGKTILTSETVPGEGFGGKTLLGA